MLFKIIKKLLLLKKKIKKSSLTLINYAVYLNRYQYNYIYNYIHLIFFE